MRLGAGLLRAYEAENASWLARRPKPTGETPVWGVWPSSCSDEKRAYQDTNGFDWTRRRAYESALSEARQQDAADSAHYLAGGDPYLARERLAGRRRERGVSRDYLPPDLEARAPSAPIRLKARVWQCDLPWGAAATLPRG
ncbi:hypothetical protein Pla175_27800 [Pirellulimonas nuda]|uniref:Uncharacterized protein n=1 Tax=Pirellulimonas nuda TaxID=2528009 RepID=A0A518DD50_9BACT|nr:hypothetical protein Pla175_27800 [Pirellulimonas nuda]